MNELTRIQMVVYLQAVDLFTHCTAEQMVRIASIASQRRFAAGETIYATSDPPEAMYCVAEGSVVITSPAGGERRTGPKEVFGVEAILSDRLRAETACAAESTLALVIDAEDFFDLLSNNIEIVKALFRKLLRPSNASPLPEETRHASPAAAPNTAAPN